jgi:stage II sporulation protein P
VHKTYTVSPSDVYVQVGNAFVKNVTDYGSDTVLAAAEASPAFTLTDTAEPQVLIMHTHTTECYMPYTGDVYDATCSTRTTDNTQNMAAVGEVIAAQLRQAGIGVLHDTTQHDYPSYNGSYERSAATVQAYLEQYPTIRVVLDIHRDAIVSGDTVTAPIIETEEGTAAQVMIISGCDDGTMDYPDWQQNLAFAIDLQQQMEADHAGFTRPILFDYRLYNQNLTTGSLLIEVGSHGNTLEQALLAGEWIGKSLAEVLKNGVESGV